MPDQTQSYSSLPGLAPTPYRVSASASVISAPESIAEAPVVRPSTLGLTDEFEQEAA
jgi:hypothetical protein